MLILFPQPSEEEEGEIKFEWQRGAPREAYVKKNALNIKLTL